MSPASPMPKILEKGPEVPQIPSPTVPEGVARGGGRSAPALSPGGTGEGGAAGFTFFLGGFSVFC